MRRVLVTGATGFIGRWVPGLLVERGFDVHATYPPGETLPSAERGVSWQPCDLLDPRGARRAALDVRATHLMHLAWYAVPGAFWRDPANLSWTAASLELVRAFREAGGQRAVLAGTCAEYDPAAGTCSEVTSPIRPVTLYGAAKDAVRRVVEAYAEVAGMSWAWGRIFFLYGPHEPESRFVASIITSLLRGETARCSEGSQVRDFLHVEDVAGALAAILDTTVQGPVNVASGVPTSIRHAAISIADAIGARSRLSFGAKAENEPPVLVADTRRLREEVGFTPRYDLSSGLDHAIAWWRSQEKA
jgi:nucleoside-diphosphate-sugar epimerase